MKKNPLLDYEWDAIAGILAAVVAIILHFLHVIDEHIILPVVLTLMALLFINFIRHTRNNEKSADEVERIHRMVGKIQSSLSTPDILLVGPRQLRPVYQQFMQNMCGEVVLFNVCLSMYRTDPLFDSLLRPLIENPQVTGVQFILDSKQQTMWKSEVLPRIMNSAYAHKVHQPQWPQLEKNLSFILADSQTSHQLEALLSFWGEPFMSQSTERDVPRYILHVQPHSELLSQLIELERRYRAHHA